MISIGGGGRTLGSRVAAGWVFNCRPARRPARLIACRRGWVIPEESHGLESCQHGLGRTGTASLKQALESLLGGPCYHMFEVFQRPQDTHVWHAAVRGEQVDWAALLGSYSAAVDWPACTFWRELSASNPEALILLSTRDLPEKWWQHGADDRGDAEEAGAPG